MLVKMNDKKMRALVRSKIIQEELERSLFLEGTTDYEKLKKKAARWEKKIEISTGPLKDKLQAELDAILKDIADFIQPGSKKGKPPAVTNIPESDWTYIYNADGSNNEAAWESIYYYRFDGDDPTSMVNTVSDLIDTLVSDSDDTATDFFQSDADVTELIVTWRKLKSELDPLAGAGGSLNNPGRGWWTGPFEWSEPGRATIGVISDPLIIVANNDIDKLKKILANINVASAKFAGETENQTKFKEVGNGIVSLIQVMSSRKKFINGNVDKGFGTEAMVKVFGVFQYASDIEAGKIKNRETEEKDEISSSGIDIGFAKLQDFLGAEAGFTVTDAYKGRASKDDLKKTEYLIEFEKTMQALIELVYSIIKNDLGYSPQEAAIKTNNIGILINNLDGQRGQMALGRIGYNKDPKFGWWGSIVNFLADLKAGNVKTIPMKPLVMPEHSIIKEAYLDSFPTVGDGSTGQTDPDAGTSLPKTDKKTGGGTGTPQGKSMIAENESVKKMQLIFMGTSGDKGGTPDLKFKDDGKWGKYTQRAWEKYLKARLPAEDFEKVGSSGGRPVKWSSGGHAGANQIHSGAGYSGTAASALKFVQALGDSMAKGDKGGAGATDPGDSTSGSKEIVTMPVLDNNGNTIISVHMYKDAIKSFKNYKGIGRWIGADFKAKFLSGGQFSDEDVEKFSITIPGIDYKVPLKDISKITYKDKKRDKLIIHRPGPNIVLFRDAETNTWSAK